jgi:hypothetical protein
LISLGFQSVSQLVSYGDFCTVWPFDSRDEPHATLSHTHTGPGSNRDSSAAKPYRAVFCASFGIPASDSTSDDLQLFDPAQKIARKTHTSSHKTIQVVS